MIRIHFGWFAGLVISVQDWAEIRRLSLSEGWSGRQIAAHLRVSRNTVRKALASAEPPKYRRDPRGSLVDDYDEQIRELLVAHPRMPATVIAERIGYQHSSSVLRARVAELRPHYLGVDPADRLEFAAGELAQCDLWFPEVAVPTGFGKFARLPVLVMVSAFSRFISAVMLPSRQTGDLLSGMWQIIQAWGGVPKVLLWDNETGLGRHRHLVPDVVAFAGTLAVRVKQTRPADPESKGIVERANQYLETSFLPGRSFASPADFNTQVTQWLDSVGNTRRVRHLQARPVDLLSADLAAMTALPPIAPRIGVRTRVRLPRDYYVRVAGADYSVHPSVIGRQVDVTASLSHVVARHGPRVVAQHARSWAKHVTITDPTHRHAAAEAREHFQQQPRGDDRDDAAEVELRNLADYDDLFTPGLREAS